ncbi:MAG: di-heme oxidoredictase family protein [Myxococcota bacterium]
MSSILPRTLPVALAVAACGGPVAEPDPTWAHYADRLGDPIADLPAELATAYALGEEVMLRDFNPNTGLGPSFNADSCHSCHGVPIAGGGAPHYRDFFLVRRPRWDGALEDVGTNGVSPVRNLYSLDGSHVIHEAEPDDVALYGRRNAPPMFGVGLFEFVSDAHILSREDADDADGDGISGRANYEQARVGRFGYKSQASSLESFNRGAMLNQMGITSNPLFYTHPEEPVQTAFLQSPPSGEDVLEWLAPARAWAQVSAPGEPTRDDDAIADPELTDDDQLALLIFSTYIAPPRPAARTPETADGARAFDKVGCTSCHVPTLESRIGPIPAYTDLLVHDLGEANSDGIQAGFASPQEFRTQPLWGVAITAPYLHDGSAETLEAAILAHGGEAEATTQAYRDLPADEQAGLIGFLESLSPYVDHSPGLVAPDDAMPERAQQPGPDDVGVQGGPSRDLTADERTRWLTGRDLYDRNVTPEQGLGTVFNGDSCRACHQDPVLGGAGGIDTNVLRYGGLDTDGHYVALEQSVLPRSVLPGQWPVRLPEEAMVIEARQPLTTLGVRFIQSLTDAQIEAGADPDDVDGDGISGRVRRLPDGRLGRYGWKAQIPSLTDFAADASLAELGLTLPQDYSDFTNVDDDDVADPEATAAEADDLTFYMSLLSAPDRKVPDDAAQAARGEALFADLNCSGCHLPDLAGVPAYTDLLLHDVADTASPLVEQDAGVLATEFRTPPLWGVVDTAPYLHDGSAATLHDAVLGHYGEAFPARQAYEALSDSDRAALDVFLRSL